MFAKNTFWNLVYQLTAVVAGFLVPRAIIGVYGSEVNGLVTFDRRVCKMDPARMRKINEKLHF